MVAPVIIAAAVQVASSIIQLQASSSVLKKQADIYKANAARALAEGDTNADKVLASGREYIGGVQAQTAGNGIDVDSPMAQNNERVAQKAVNDDVFATMYSAAKEAAQQQQQANATADQMTSNNFQKFMLLGPEMYLGSKFIK